MPVLIRGAPLKLTKPLADVQILSFVIKPRQIYQEEGFDMDDYSCRTTAANCSSYSS